MGLRAGHPILTVTSPESPQRAHQTPENTLSLRTQVQNQWAGNGGYGLAVEGGDLSDIDLRHGFDIGFRVGIPMADGAIFSHEKTLFEALAPSFGLEPSDYGRTFRTGGDAFRLTAINPNRPKYPISAERIADGRGFKFTAENVAMYLKVSD